MKTYIENILDKDVMLNVSTDFEDLVFKIPYEKDFTGQLLDLAEEPLKCYVEILMYSSEGIKELSETVITSKVTVNETLEVLMISLGERGFYEACIMIKKYLNGNITQ
jgi:hypothetical protein